MKAVIKKAKVPVNKYNFDYEMCVLKNGNMKVGQTKDWNLVSGYLKEVGILAKAEKGSGWVLEGETYPTLAVIQDKYYQDYLFRNQLQNLVIENYGSSAFTVA